MKYLLILCTALLFSACGGDDHLTIEEYIEESNLETEVTASGLHYIIQDRGGDETPSLSSSIDIAYSGFYLGGDVFDSSDDATFPLDNLILGWQEGIQLIGKGGSITLLIPSNLAYGSRGAGDIPGNTDLGFDITLHDFK